MENQTFFFWRWTVSEGRETEADQRRGRPLGGETAGVTGEEEITGFSQSTETDSNLSPNWRKKNSGWNGAFIGQNV